jgi:hypothetical protein
MTRLLMRFFPPAWRARYGEELTELVTETGLTPRVAADLARAGTTERVRAARAALNGGTSMTFGPGWRHPTAWAVAGALVLLPIVYFLVIGALGAPISPIDSVLNTQRYLDLALLISPAVAALLAAVPLVRLGFTKVEGGGSEVSLSVRLRAANVAVVVVGLGIACFLVGHIVFESVLRLGS